MNSCFATSAQKSVFTMEIVLGCDGERSTRLQILAGAAVQRKAGRARIAAGESVRAWTMAAIVVQPGGTSREISTM
jgi:hypothetical protein